MSRKIENKQTGRENPEAEPDMIERQPEISPLPDAETATEREQTVSAELKSEIEQAESLDDLRRAISRTEGVKGSKDFYPADYITAKIDESEKYLMENLDRIVLGSISGAYAAERNVLGEKTKLITQGGELMLRQKVREIMKGILADRYEKYRDKFEEYKRQYVAREVSQSFNINQLERVVKQVQPIGEGKQTYEAAEMAQALEQMVESIKAPTLKGSGEYINFLSLRGADLQQKIEAVFGANAGKLPEYAGIRQRAHDVLQASVKEEQVGGYISSASSEEGGGLLRRAWGRVKGWFKR